MSSPIQALPTSATVRTFRAPDTQSALKAIKAALGADAVILSTRELKAGPFRKAEIEVTAALSLETAPLPETPPAAKSSGALMRYPPPAPKPAPAPAPVEAARPPEPERVRTLSAEPELNDELLTLRSAMEEVRQELRTVSRQARTQRERGLDPVASDLFNHLLERGMEEALAEELVRQALDSAEAFRPASLWATARKLLADRLVPARAPWLQDRPRLIALVGPTGVGKTTTLAKIAARALMESKLQVALVTVDTYRVGASEQITRYGEIMGVPTFVAKTQQDLQKALRKCERADLVLIDTAGRSVSEAVARQAEFLKTVEGIRLHLVLSAATGAKELAQSAERYRSLQPERLILTKMDEAAGPASLLSAAVRVGRPLACMTNGQSVPEDLHCPSQSEWVDLVMGDWTGMRTDLTRAGGR